MSSVPQPDSGEALRPPDVPASRGYVGMAMLATLLLAGMLAALTSGSYRVSAADVFRVILARLGFGAGDANVAGIASAVV